MPNATARRRGSLRELLVAGAFSLWDFYVGPYTGGVRPFDLLGAGGAILQRMIAWRRSPHVSAWRRIGLAALLITVAWALIMTCFHDPSTRWKPVAGILLGIAVLLALLADPPSPRALERTTRVLLIVHAGALIIQWAWYRGTGTILNFHAITGGDPRLLSAFFRPAGLFLEPGHFAVFMSMMLLVRLRVVRRLDAPMWFGLAAMLLSLSLLGILAVAWVLVRARPVIGLGVTAAVTSVGAALAASLPRDSILYNLVLSRLTNLATDSSAQGRFGGLVGGGTGAVMSPYDWIFGRGFGYEYVAIGSSSVSFLLSATGILGCVTFLLGMSLASARGNRFATLCDVGFLLLAAPFWTFPMWWWWLAALVTARGRVAARARGTGHEAPYRLTSFSLTHAATS
jgi:hypothetical protein